jgi:hypothetical protein
LRVIFLLTFGHQIAIQLFEFDSKSPTFFSNCKPMTLGNCRSCMMAKSDEKEKSGKETKVKSTPAADDAAAGSGAEVAGVANLEKIRDILFGAQIREYERRFARMEERLQTEVASLREDAKNRCEALESYIREEISSLSDQLKGEQEKRSEAIAELSGSLADNVQNFEKRAVQMEEKLAQNARELRDQILAQSKQLADEINTRHDKTTTALDRESEALRTAKVDRVALSELFSEIALRLSDDPALKLILDADALSNA